MLLSGCGVFFVPPPSGEPGEQSVEPYLGSAHVQEENRPIRVLRIAVLSNGKLSEYHLRTAFSDASYSLAQQVGISLEVTYVADTLVSSSRPLTLMSELDAYHRLHPEFEIVFGVLARTEEEEKECSPHCYGGMNPQENMVLLHITNSAYIVHELGHAFLGWGHSPTGVMHPDVVGTYFSVNDRRRVLKNKWKAFHPPLPKDHY